MVSTRYGVNDFADAFSASGTGIRYRVPESMYGFSYKLIIINTKWYFMLTNTEY
jgi:hypothetical protein